MAQSIKDYFNSLGVYIDVDESKFPDPAAKRAVTLEALRNKKIGTDAITGADTFINEEQAKFLYGRYESKQKSGKIGGLINDIRTERDFRRIQNDFARSQGMAAGAGATSGYSMGFGGYRRAGRGQLLKSAVPDTARAVGENFLNSLGVATSQQRMQYKSSGAIGKAGALLGPGLGAGIIFSTIVNGDDMYETMTFNMAAAAGMAGFTAGSRTFGALAKGATKAENTVSDSMKGITRVAPGSTALQGGKMRIAAGAVGGALGFATGAALVGGTMWAASDLTSNNSVLASVARGYARLPSNAGTEQNNRTLTMRQQALQQLSQSAMNDRASLLGNEAAVLRGVL